MPAKVFIEDDSSELFYGKGIWYIKKEQEYDHYSIELIFKKRNNYECNSGTFILINGSGILEIKSPWTSLFGWVGEAAEGNRFEFFRK